ncbi:hypothetical protein CFBP1590__3440 [Pseudomonas viridiflava]|uniref:Uncharacterized protein n=1 Tax=Pseudomonas viridiflava TaxID=33069 RepID=A0A1Y6JM62_PSEVI|nr:hypothetical protein CFBP1590__3440 [Pseudomonas viridiflava]VVO01819.1 hypothetical protein PS689_02729 [Pseudomonas fluorescens]
MLQRGNAAQDAPRPLLSVMQSLTGCLPTRSIGTIRTLTKDLSS